jgi:NADH:ubiquinone reductase (H+-translocating)
MAKKIVVVGSGFAGMWAALAAARLRRQVPEMDVQIVVVSPRPVLVIRPRLYATAFNEMSPDLAALFEQVGVQHISAHVEHIDTTAHTIECKAADGRQIVVTWDRLVLAAGSGLNLPSIPGLSAHSFNVDQIDAATALESHLQSLKALPDNAARNTVVVVGGGFTGIETAAEMPARLRRLFGDECEANVVMLERESTVGPDLGPGPRPIILSALQDLGVIIRTDAAVTAVDANGVVLANGDRIEASTVIWTAGPRANPLTLQVKGKRDSFGRLHVSRDLRVPSAPDIFATGDVAFASTDDEGNHALMSCQHAIALGRAAGHNVMADLLGRPTRPYSQHKYVTCLDLGPWGAVYTEGWERTVHLQGAEAKALKTTINTSLIYPPKGTTEEILAAADPSIPVVA